MASTIMGYSWILSGDFNVVLYSCDRVNGNEVSITETKDFLEFM